MRIVALLLGLQIAAGLNITKLAPIRHQTRRHIPSLQNLYRRSDYVHRLRLPTTRERYHRAFGVSLTRENTIRRSPERKFDSTNENVFVVDNLSLKRSTVRPPTQEEWLTISAPKSTSISQSDLPIRMVKMTTEVKSGNDFKKNIKGIKPAKVDKGAAVALAELLKREADSLRKNILIKKISETQRQVELLEQRERELKSNQLVDGFLDKIAHQIEQQIIEKKKKKKSSIKDDITVKHKKNGYQEESLYVEDQLLKHKGFGSNGHHVKLPDLGTPQPTFTQTLVESSPVLVEGTTTPTTSIFTQSRRIEGEVLTRAWTRPSPISPPTASPAQLLATTTPSAIAFGSLIQLEGDASPIRMPTNDIIDDTAPPPPYPFSHCYMNKDGFMCCNRYLEGVMRRSYHKMKRSHLFKDCSVHRIATVLQRDAQQVFNTTFEAVVGLDDFALRAHFSGDLMCKIEEDGRFINLYATAMPSRNGINPDPLNTITPISFFGSDENTLQDNNFENDVRRSPRSGKYRLPYHEMSREQIETERATLRIL